MIINNMKQKITQGIHVKIHASYTSLKPTEKKIADYILKNAEEFENLTTEELAIKTNTSKATITRFCQRLGYEGFKQFRLSAIKDQITGVKDVYESINEEDELEVIIEKICSSNATSCADTALLLDSTKLEEVAKLILSRDKIFLFGDGAATPIVTDLYQKMLRLGLFCVYSPDRRFQSLQSVLVTERDLALAFDLSGSSKHTVSVIKSARQRKCKTVGICNSIGSALAKEAEINLYAPGRMNSSFTGTFGPRIALLCIVDCLFTAIIKFSNNKFSESLRTTMNSIIEDWV